MKPIDLNGVQNGISSTEFSRTQKVDSTPAKNAGLAIRTLSASDGSDQVTVSSQAEVLSRLVSKVSEVSDIRHERVASLRQLVASGQYMVPTDVIADAIMRDEIS